MILLSIISIHTPCLTLESDLLGLSSGSIIYRGCEYGQITSAWVLMRIIYYKDYVKQMLLILHISKLLHCTCHTQII